MSHNLIRQKILLTFYIIILLFESCNKLVVSDNNSRESYLYKDTFDYLCSPMLGGRSAGSNGSKLAADFIVSSINNQHNIVRESFSRDGLELENIFVNISGDIDSTVIIGAHYDSYPSYNANFLPGADDNASGVSVLINLANQLSDKKLKYSVLFAFWDAEEIGRYGSEHYLNRTNDNIVLYINLDTCGNSSAYNLGYLYDMNHPKTLKLIDSVDTYGIFQVQGYAPKTYTTDCQFFQLYNLPFVSISPISLPYYLHKVSDTPSIINYNRLSQINRILYQMLISL